MVGVVYVHIVPSARVTLEGGHAHWSFAENAVKTQVLPEVLAVVCHENTVRSSTDNRRPTRLRFQTLRTHGNILPFNGLRLEQFGY